MNRTKIPYVLNPDGTPGYGWPIITGCGQPPEVCATRSLCWARLGNHRFGKAGWSKLYLPDFSPKFNEHLLNAPFLLRKPSTIAVSFTGDMFGPGVSDEWIQKVLRVVRSCEVRYPFTLDRIFPDHKFLFLTKSPWNLAQFNPWPPNAWVGASATDFLSSAHAFYTGLVRVEALHKWLSFEPLLGETKVKAQDFRDVGISWVVIGEQTGPGWLVPKLEWVLDIIEAADAMKIPIWLKANLLKLYPQLPRRQELPWKG